LAQAGVQVGKHDFEPDILENPMEQKLRELTVAELDHVSGGAIRPVQVNGGGNTPNGNANGVPTVNLNPSDFAPPGQNK
jgi:hypothetical protein